MAGTPVFLVENIFSVVQFPDHSVNADEEATGSEDWRVATGRRSSQDKWTTTTTNTTHTMTVTCNRIRTCDMIAIDRGHNLAGEAIKLQGSNDAFTSTEDIIDITMPTYSAPGSIDDTLGVMTEEGAWVKRFDPRAYTWWRLTIPSMGADTMPEIVGLWLGKSYNSRSFDWPWSEEDVETLASVVVSEAGWEGAGPVTVRRRGTMGIRCTSLIDYDDARYTFAHFSRNRPMWMCADDEQADRTILIKQAGGFGFGFDGQWPFRRATQIPWVEYEPMRE